MILEVVHQNWSIEPDSWLYTHWLIYDDQTIWILDKYGYEDKPHKQDCTLSGVISVGTYQLLLRLLPTLKTSDKDVDALDGDAWQFAQYENGKQVWLRDMGYIYGIKPFLQYAAILESIKKRIARDVCSSK